MANKFRPKDIFIPRVAELNKDIRHKRGLRSYMDISPLFEQILNLLLVDTQSGNSLFLKLDHNDMADGALYIIFGEDSCVVFFFFLWSLISIYPSRLLHKWNYNVSIILAEFFLTTKIKASLWKI